MGTGSDYSAIYRRNPLGKTEYFWPFRASFRARFSPFALRIWRRNLRFSRYVLLHGGRYEKLRSLAVACFDRNSKNG